MPIAIGPNSTQHFITIVDSDQAAGLSHALDGRICAVRRAAIANVMYVAGIIVDMRDDGWCRLSIDEEVEPVGLTCLR